MVAQEITERAYTEYEQFLHHEHQHLPGDFAERKEIYHLTTFKITKENNTSTTHRNLHPYFHYICKKKLTFEAHQAI